MNTARRKIKIAILNISIGRYVVFWEDFYKSCERNFMVDADKDYYVFTDNESDRTFALPNVYIIHQDNMGWPYNTMKRYHLFTNIADKLELYDYVFFINGNALFMVPLSTKLLKPEKELITVQHPGNYKLPIEKMPFERNPESNAYIRVGAGKYYVQGAFVGGKSKSFIKMSKELDLLTEKDLEQGIIAVWHDESFLNMYVSKHDNFQILGRQYLYFEEYKHPYEAVIMLRDKNKEGKLNAIRGISKRKLPIGRFIIKCKNMKESLFIKLGKERWLSYIDQQGCYIDSDISEL